MRKIIGFRLSLRFKEVQRRAKKAKIDLEALGLDQANLESLLQKTSKTLKPAALFSTFAHPDEDQPLLSPLPGLAYSLVLITLGQDLAVKTNPEDTTLDRLKPIIEELALEEALRFAASILEEEAAQDSCELSPLTPLSEPAALEMVLKKLEGAKIGVSLRDGRLAPPASKVVSISWLSKSTAKSKPKCA